MMEKTEIEETVQRVVEINGGEYELKYNLKRIEDLEAALQGKALMGLMMSGSGVLSINDLKIVFAYGLKKVGADAFVAPKTGKEYATMLIETEGYIKLTGLVLSVLQEDCPFFFQAD